MLGREGVGGLEVFRDEKTVSVSNWWILCNNPKSSLSKVSKITFLYLRSAVLHNIPYQYPIKVLILDKVLYVRAKSQKLFIKIIQYFITSKLQKDEAPSSVSELNLENVGGIFMVLLVTN